MLIVQKIMFFILVFCILYVVKKGIDIAFSYIRNEQFDNENGRVWLFIGLALSYIVTIIFTGFKLF